ncbi:MAG: transcriptional regulator [Ignavibacteria bacterium]|nr:transcriptional regulator [Ignavibacteria bacterium]
MSEFNYLELDDVIHSRIRTAVMALLISVEEAEFSFIRDKVNATDGNLSIHLRKLEESGYITVKKEFINRKPVSRYRITSKGRKAFENYIKKIEGIIKRKT